MIDPISERDRIEAEDRPLVADRYGDEARLGWPVLLPIVGGLVILLAYVGMMIWGAMS